LTDIRLLEWSRRATGIDTFTVPTDTLNPGSHSVHVSCFVEGALNDEEKISFTVYDKLIDIEGLSAPEAVQQAIPLRASWVLSNHGIAEENVDLTLECRYGRRVLKIDCGSRTLNKDDSTRLVTYVPTNGLRPGFASLRVKATARGEEFSSSEILTVIVILDTDQDGLPDPWEQRILNVDPDDEIMDVLQVDPDDDFDRDDLTNQQEYALDTDPTDADTDDDGLSDGHEILAGTDPLEKSDVFAVVGCEWTGTSFGIQWTAKAARTYQVLWSVDLDTWLPASSGALHDEMSMQTATADGILKYSDPHLVVLPRSFYRVEVLE